MDEEGNDDDMILMYELMDEDDSIFQASAKEIIVLRAEKVHAQVHGPGAGDDSETYVNVKDVSAIFSRASHYGTGARRRRPDSTPTAKGRGRRRRWPSSSAKPVGRRRP